MAKSFNFSLSSPEAVLFEGETTYVSLPTQTGEIGIMADHIPLVSLISPGVLRIETKGEDKFLAVGAGFIKITPEKIMAFVQTAEFAESIDEHRAIVAMKDAAQVMKEQIDEVSLADATGLLERNIARLKAVEHKKKRSHR